MESQPVVEIPFLNAGRRANDFYLAQLPIFRGIVNRLPSGLDAVFVTADLQGREELPRTPGEPLRLLGDALPSLLVPMLSDLRVSSLHNSGIILAGDFYTYPDLHGRGGTGDVTSVWQTFADHFKLVVGVAGNHDTFSPNANVGLRRPRPMGDHVHFLDETRVATFGMNVAGLSGVIGNPRKNFRRTHAEFIEALELVLSAPTDVLVMHDGPDATLRGCRGIAEAREVVERCKPGLVIRGHKHWPQPFVELECGVQVLNVEGTVVVLTEA